jgi:hypothetical protein
LGFADRRDRQQELVQDEQFAIDSNKNSKKLTISAISLCYLIFCVFNYGYRDSRPSPIFQSCSLKVYDYSVNFILFILLPLTSIRAIASTPCISSKPQTFLKLFSLIEIYENVSFAIYVVYGLWQITKMTFGYNCSSMLSIHMINYIVIMFSGLQVASILIMILLLLTCCCPCFCILIIGALA